MDKSKKGSGKPAGKELFESIVGPSADQLEEVCRVNGLPFFLAVDLGEEDGQRKFAVMTWSSEKHELFYVMRGLVTGEIVSVPKECAKVVGLILDALRSIISIQAGSANDRPEAIDTPEGSAEGGGQDAGTADIRNHDDLP